jgi:hypothetical protein
MACKLEILTKIRGITAIDHQKTANGDYFEEDLDFINELNLGSAP